METRIENIEIKLSYAEDLIEELNTLVYRQQQQIDWLVRELADLKTQAQAASTVPLASTSLRDEIPPHY